MLYSHTWVDHERVIRRAGTCADYSHLFKTLVPISIGFNRRPTNVWALDVILGIGFDQSEILVPDKEEDVYKVRGILHCELSGHQVVRSVHHTRF